MGGNNSTQEGNQGDNQEERQKLSSDIDVKVSLLSIAGIKYFKFS